jgi:importin subunit beta-1
MFSVPWIDYFLKEVKSDRSLSVNTKEVGKWSREMVRRQISV